MSRVLAGIVLYNPDLKRLKENIDSINAQVDQVLCVDNGSSNINEVIEKFGDTVSYIRFEENLGIAAALNTILNYAQDSGYDWFITLDQDSVCMPGLIENYLKYQAMENPGIIACSIQDRNFDVGSKRVSDIEEIDECITSASFCRTHALVDVGGFDESMFIDSVDFEICLKLRKHGYKIYKTSYIGILHEVGHGKNVRLLWKNRIAYNHSSLRNYYMARNHVYMAKKYPQDVSMLHVIIKEIEMECIILFYEKNKVEKIGARHEGFIDGIKLNMGKRRNH